MAFQVKELSHETDRLCITLPTKQTHQCTCMSWQLKLPAPHSYVRKQKHI